jgi:hypothetical protein
MSYYIKKSKQDHLKFKLDPSSDLAINNGYPTSTWNQIMVLCHRRITVVKKAPHAQVFTIFRYHISKKIKRLIVTHFLMKSIRFAFIGIFYGALYFNMKGGKDQSAYTNRLSLMFSAILLVTMSHMQTVPQIFSSRLLFYRERYLLWIC